MTVRARIYARGRIGKQSVWHYEVMDSRGNVVLYDNSCGWKQNLERALIRVEALRHMETAGHALKPYKGAHS